MRYIFMQPPDDKEEIGLCLFLCPDHSEHQLHGSRFEDTRSILGAQVEHAALALL